MLMSQNQIFSHKQAITGDAASTNIIDLGKAGRPVGAAADLKRDIGKGEPLPLLVQVVQGFNNLTRLKVSVQVDTVAAFSSPKTVVAQELALAELTAGQRFALSYVPEGVDQRYARLYYDVVGTAPSTGQITAGIVAGHQTA